MNLRRFNFIQILQRSLAIVLLSFLVASAQPALPQTKAEIDTLQKQQQQIGQQRSQLSKEQQRLKSLENAAQGQLQGLQQTVKATASQISDTESRLQAATQHLQRLEIALDKSEAGYRQKQFSTVARLRYLQRQQVDRGWAVLLQSQNLNDFLDRRRQLKRIYQTDRHAIASLQSVTQRIAQQRDQVEQQKNQIALLKQQLVAQKADAEAQAGSQVALVTRLRSDRQALEAAESQLQKDSQAIAGLIHQRIASQHGIVLRGTGRMILPCVGELTSGFGFRLHPLLGYQRFHSGIDLGADYGSVIHAADRGTVIYAGWYGGYGNAVIIDHGTGITTLYGHTSELYVTEGQTVQQGQPIAAVGSTGLSTGPHLHFEVRENGEPVDPMTYL